MAYEYSPLDIREYDFRLLRIQKGISSDWIECKLIDSYLDDDRRLPYKALSYTWGDSGPTQRVYLDGCPFGVTENLHCALQASREPKKDVLVWVDAICIDQDNAEEKGHQVNRMAEIYRGASEVLIWLGESNEGIDELMKSICRINSKATTAGKTGSEDEWNSLCRRFKEKEIPQIDPMACERQAEALKEILKRPWFDRVWILQEVANARSAIIICGASKCSSATFSLMPSLMGLTVSDHIQAVLDMMPRVRNTTWAASKQDLHFLLGKFAKSKATVERDRIYALLGISNDAPNTVRFYPFYQIEHREVLRNTLCFFLFKEVLDPSYSFPALALQELTKPLPFLAAKTLAWTLSQTEDLLDSSRQTAGVLVERMNGIELKKGDVLTYLADLYAGDNSQLRTVLSEIETGGDPLLSLGFGDKRATFTITSNVGARSSASLVFPVPGARATDDQRRPRHELAPVPFKEDEDMSQTIPQLQQTGVSQETLMHAYTWARDRAGVEAQLDHGAAVDATDEYGSTALHLAVRRGVYEVVELLLSRGADPDKADANGMAPLHLAISV